MIDRLAASEEERQQMFVSQTNAVWKISFHSSLQKGMIWPGQLVWHNVFTDLRHSISREPHTGGNT